MPKSEHSNLHWAYTELSCSAAKAVGEAIKGLFGFDKPIVPTAYGRKSDEGLGRAVARIVLDELKDEMNDAKNEIELLRGELKKAIDARDMYLDKLDDANNTIEYLRVNTQSIESFNQLTDLNTRQSRDLTRMRNEHRRMGEALRAIEKEVQKVEKLH